MKLTDFKKGDIIHRTKPRKFNSTNFLSFGKQEEQEDYSFVESPLEFLGIKSGLFFYKYFRNSLIKDISHSSVERVNDDSWDYFPKEYLKKEYI